MSGLLSSVLLDVMPLPVAGEVGSWLLGTPAGLATIVASIVVVGGFFIWRRR